ncbi:hypothetical protein C2S53_009081 [Perilla frutescens var. hirtella]|uniref:Cytochrome P450 n=1 Tax=Perilla frutescens var. hirtella TaxID=608512 RepID=A0AAD4NWL9_PERFH|nr:hypothetical protein C2S53_009081 [Perilla frutescens var. hirtella]
MDEIKIQSIIFPALASLILLWCIRRRWHRKPNGIKNPPPSPPKLPIIGNLHQLGSFPHRNLQLLAKKHGPLMLLRLGRLPVLVVSTADAAREIMKTHDLTFSNRPLYKVHKKVAYDGKGFALGPYNEFWRQIKSIFVLKLLNSKRVQSSRSIREEETSLFVKKIRESSSSPVNLSEMFTKFSNDVVCRSAFGGKYSETENGKKFLTLVKELSEVLGFLGVGAFVPWLSWIDRVSGFDAKVDRIAKGLDDLLEGVIEERLENLKVQSLQENFIDILLDIYMNETIDVAIEKDNIKAVLLDVFAAGTDTTAVVLEWTMTELLQHPKMMEKLQSEVRGIVEHKKNITDGDLEKMHYLKAVIKESLRFHPPLPLLLPRIAREDVNIKGYDISAGTVVMTNAWAISKDPLSWDEPEKFEPERFLNSSIDVKGQDFELIPFGAGRRGCPGIGFAMLKIELLLASLVQKFNWKLPEGDEGKDLDMSESVGITIHRVTPLVAVATQAT